MQEKVRRIRSISRRTWFEELKSDPIRLIELSLVALGMLVAALSSYFSWQAASAAADQARYAREALSAADANATFRTYIASWNKLCAAITPPEYKIIVGTPSLIEEDNLVVVVENYGFDRALFYIDEYNRRVRDQEDIVRDNLLEFRTFLPEDLFVRPDQALTVMGYFHTIKIPEMGSEEIKTQLVKASALCHYYTEEQLRWFKDKSYKIVPIIFLLARMEIDYSEDLSPGPGRH